MGFIHDPSGDSPNKLSKDYSLGQYNYLLHPEIGESKKQLAIYQHVKPKADDRMVWFKKDRKVKQDEHMLHLKLAPGHADLNPNAQPSNLLYGKLKKGTLLERFDHPVL